MRAVCLATIFRMLKTEFLKPLIGMTTMYAISKNRDSECTATYDV